MQFQQDILNQILVVKKAVNKFVRKCQLTKNGILNSNLLDGEEIYQIVAELETLPYANEVQTVEYGKLTIYANGSVLLYAQSIPQVVNAEFNQLLV